MRPFLWISAFVTLVAILLVPVIFLYTERQIPPLDSEFDLLRVLRLNIESERKGIQLGQYERSNDSIEFARPDISRIPKNLVSLYITERGCPTYFQTPREEGFQWSKRALLGAFNVESDDSDGWCEKLFASSISRRLPLNDNLKESVAIYKIHGFLKKDQLVAYDLMSVRLENGVIGVEAAAKSLFGRPLKDLSLSELAELTLALPPFAYWDQMKTCQNPMLIKQNRDVVLDNLRRMSLIPEDLARSAMRQPVSCARQE